MKGVFKILLLAAIALLCRGRVEQCRNVDGFNFPADNQTSFVSYSYVQTPGVAGSCESVNQECVATIDSSKLRQRSWYIDDTKAAIGFTYKPQWIQIHNIQCPPGTVLHIIPLRLDTEGTATTCPDNDFVTIDIPGMESIDLCGGMTELTGSEAYNNGFGLIAEGGNASITFCTNDNAVVTDGFTVRATCVDPLAAFLPSCVDFLDVISTPGGREFVDSLREPPIDEVMKANIIHKRDAEEILSSVKSWGVSPDKVPKRVARILKALKTGSWNRQKRFALAESFSFDLADISSVRYVAENQLIVEFNNGTTATFTVFWLITFNDVIGTRIFDIEAPPELLFSGPGKLDIMDGIAVLDYTIDPDDISGVILPSTLEEASNLNFVSQYLYRNYIRPYPFTCPADQEMVPEEERFPTLPPAAVEDPRWRSIAELDIISPEIHNGTCTRNTVPSLAPSRGSITDRQFFAYCQYFYNSCNPLVRAVCAEVVSVA